MPQCMKQKFGVYFTIDQFGGLISMNEIIIFQWFEFDLLKNQFHVIKPQKKYTKHFCVERLFLFIAVCVCECFYLCFLK